MRQTLVVLGRQHHDRQITPYALRVFFECMLWAIRSLLVLQWEDVCAVPGFHDRIAVGEGVHKLASKSDIKLGHDLFGTSSGMRRECSFRSPALSPTSKPPTAMPTMDTHPEVTTS
jgi:hypothetical protein